MRVIADALHFRRMSLDEKEESAGAFLIPHGSATYEILGHRRSNGVPMTTDWKKHGLRIVRAGQLDINTPQTPGMTRAEAISHARVGAQKLWAGTVVVQPDAKTGPHHHGELETVIYVVKGRARFRWGERLEFVDEAGPGDFVYVPPYVPHQELNARRDEPVEAVIVRSGQEPIVVNLNIPTPDPAPTTPQPDPFHS
jgi:uncharacterized RmlC-like cupin family protein